MALQTNSDSFFFPQLLSLNVDKMGALEHPVASKSKDAFLDEVASQMDDAFLSSTITCASLGSSRIGT
jgi:hypothetical protein